MINIESKLSIDDNYPDGGMSFETYTNALMLEMESIGELKKLNPGETLTHTERWEMVDSVECDLSTPEGIEKAVKTYIK